MPRRNACCPGIRDVQLVGILLRHYVGHAHWQHGACAEHAQQQLVGNACEDDDNAADSEHVGEVANNVCDRTDMLKE